MRCDISHLNLQFCQGCDGFEGNVRISFLHIVTVKCSGKGFLTKRCVVCNLVIVSPAEIDNTTMTLNISVYVFKLQTKDIIKFFVFKLLTKDTIYFASLSCARYIFQSCFTCTEAVMLLPSADEIILKDMGRVDWYLATKLQWRHNERVGVSNHRCLHCLLNCWFRHRSKKSAKLRVTGLFAGNSLVTSEFPAQKASYTRKMFPFDDVIIMT